MQISVCAADIILQANRALVKPAPDILYVVLADTYIDVRLLLKILCFRDARKANSNQKKKKKDVVTVVNSSSSVHA